MTKTDELLMIAARRLEDGQYLAVNFVREIDLPIDEIGPLWSTMAAVLAGYTVMEQRQQMAVLTAGNSVLAGMDKRTAQGFLSNILSTAQMDDVLSRLKVLNGNSGGTK